MAVQNGTLLNLLVQKKILENKYAEIEVEKHIDDQIIPRILTCLRVGSLDPFLFDKLFDRKQAYSPTKLN